MDDDQGQQANYIVEYELPIGHRIRTACGRGRCAVTVSGTVRPPSANFRVSLRTPRLLRDALELLCVCE